MVFSMWREKWKECNFTGRSLFLLPLDAHVVNSSSNWLKSMFKPVYVLGFISTG